MTPDELLEEIRTGSLSVELIPLSDKLDDAAIYAALNRRDIDSPGKITSHDIKQYLALIGVRLSIMDSTALACREATVALDDFPLFDLTNPYVNAKFLSVLDELVAEPLVPDFTETHKQTLLGLAAQQISRAEQLDVSISQTDVTRALRNNNGTARTLA